MIEKAYGKINLSLDITGIREDGYHLLDMVMVPVDFYDVLDIQLADEDSFTSNTDLRWDESNLIYKGVQAMRREYELDAHFSIVLDKVIPVQAGLGGGSSECAAVIRAINSLCELNKPLEELIPLAVRLGADVPYCLYSKPARVQGIGEQIRLLEKVESREVLLLKPIEGINTAEAFRLSDEMELIHPDIDEVERRLINGEALGEVMGNSLQLPAERLVGCIKEIYDECVSEGFSDTLMSGSGSTVFVLADGVHDLDALQEKMAEKVDFIVKTKIKTD